MPEDEVAGPCDIGVFLQLCRRVCVQGTTAPVPVTRRGPAGRADDAAVGRGTQTTLQGGGAGHAHDAAGGGARRRRCRGAGRADYAAGTHVYVIRHVAAFLPHSVLYPPCFLPAPSYYLNTYDGPFTTLCTTGFDKDDQTCSLVRRTWNGDPVSTGTPSTSCPEPCVTSRTHTLPEGPDVFPSRLESLAVPRGPACSRVTLLRQLRA